MNNREPVDTAAPWTIKSISVATREAVTAAARRENLTVGGWLERRVGEWLADGSPVPVATPGGQPPTPTNLGELAQLVQSAIAAAAVAGVPVPPAFARDAMLTARRAMRQTRPVSLPRRPPVAIEG